MKIIYIFIVSTFFLTNSYALSVSEIEMSVLDLVILKYRESKITNIHTGFFIDDQGTFLSTHHGYKEAVSVDAYRVDIEHRTFGKMKDYYIHQCIGDSHYFDNLCVGKFRNISKNKFIPLESNSILAPNSAVLYLNRCNNKDEVLSSTVGNSYKSGTFNFYKKNKIYKENVDRFIIKTPFCAKNEGSPVFSTNYKLVGIIENEANAGETLVIPIQQIIDFSKSKFDFKGIFYDYNSFKHR